MTIEELADSALEEPAESGLDHSIPYSHDKLGGDKQGASADEQGRGKQGECNTSTTACSSSDSSPISSSHTSSDEAASSTRSMYRESDQGLPNLLKLAALPPIYNDEKQPLLLKHGPDMLEACSARKRATRWLLQLVLAFLAGHFATEAWSSLVGHSLWRVLPAKPASTASQTIPATSDLGRTVVLGGIHYYVPSKPKAVLPIQRPPAVWADSLLFPLTVITSTETTFHSSHLTALLSEYASVDDVWSPAFSEHIMLSYTGEGGIGVFDLSTEAPATTFILNKYLQLGKTAHAKVGSEASVPAGPYFASYASGVLSLYEAWRLYEDTERAFIYGVVPDTEQNDTHRVLSAMLPHSGGLAAIGVPSRLYYTKTADKPLAGVRVSVKDLYDIKGLKTSMGSRAWLSLYPAATATAPSVQRLIDLGAVVVGKTRTSQFGNGQYGTADNVDFAVPFNKRGDGYQDPSSSSSGAGAAAGAYGFIDVHIGSDTGGSVRAPAAVNGVFGNRPSQGALNMSGVLPLSPEMDTAAFLTADAGTFAEFGKAFYGGNTTFRSYPSFPRQLLYLVDPDSSLDLPSPGFFPHRNDDAALIYNKFISDLEHFLGVKREEVDFYARFTERFGEEPAEYIGPAWSLLTAYEQCNLVGKRFEAEYAAAHDGDRPFVDPPVRFQWDYGAELTEANRTFYLERKERFQRFVAEELMEANSTEACSNALTVFPTSTGLPSYKSDYHAARTVPFNGWNRYSISQLGQVPEVVIPIGQIPYQSKITQTTKYLPISLSIQAAAGCDFVLYDLVAALAGAGIITNPTVGSSNTFA